MAWSPTMLDYLASRTRGGEVWILEVIPAYQEPNGGAYSIASAPGFADEAIIGQGGPTFTGARVSPVEWSSTIGGFTLPIAGDPSNLLRYITRGTCVRLYLGLRGWTQFDVMGWGMVWSLRGSGTQWTLDVRDPLQALNNRLSTSEPSLFNDNGTTTTVTTDGGGGTITVATTSGFAMDSAGAGVGLIKIEEEYITYTGTTATTFTGCSRSVFGSTYAVHAAATTVTEHALLRGHPLDIVRRLLVSRGVIGNSAWDDYPATWGFGLLQTLVDLDDIQAWATNIVKVASGSYQWDVIVQGTWETPASQLRALLASAGLFLTQRQGAITCRGAVGPVSYTSPAYEADYGISDEDIASGWGFVQDAWDPNVSVEYETSKMTTNANSLVSGNENPATLPSAKQKEYDVSSVVFNNEPAVRNEMDGRLTNFARRVPESLQLRCVGMRMAGLAPGALVPLTSSRLRGRFADAYARGRLIWVSQVSPDWMNNNVELRLLTYPTTSGEFEP